MPGRQVDDNAHILVRFENGAKGMLWASMVATGNTHGLHIRVYGSDASIGWVQENDGVLGVRFVDAAVASDRRRGVVDAAHGVDDGGRGGLDRLHIQVAEA